MSLIQKIQQGCEWRWKAISFHVWRFLSWRSPWPRIFLQWPWPVSKPYQRKRLRVSTAGGLGDELMCTVVLREIKRRNPDCHLTFLSRRPEFYRHLPYIDAVDLFKPDDTKSVHYLLYSRGEFRPPDRPLISLMGECVGLVMPPGKIDPPRLKVSEELRAHVAALPEPRIIVQPLASNWTTNKSWPVSHWVDLIKKLTERFTVIEVGTESAFAKVDLGPRFVSLAGKTDLDGFAYVISTGSVFVGPVSGGTHLASAFEIPLVVIVGGYESPRGYQMANSTWFYSPVSCSPCWACTCSYELKCLKMIQPASVFATVCRAAEGKPQTGIIETVPQPEPSTLK